MRKRRLLPPHLYIHIPYCHRICPYCGFYKHTPAGTDHRAFVRALLGELDHHLASLAAPGSPPSPLETISLGGGTPTALSPAHLGELLAGLGARLDLAALEEFGIEANPATFDRHKAELMRSGGITRASLGVQSWTPATLTTLGRDHSPADAERAFGDLRAAGFRSINIDLMFSVPGQSAASWGGDLARTLALEPDHISAYNLTYEEDTEFLERHRGGELDASPERDADLFYAAVDLLEESGYEHYEISNYARPGHRSAHNAGYWAGRDYLGLGPGAFSTVCGERWKNLADTAAYIRAVEAGAFRQLVTDHETLRAEDRRTERIGLGLRTAGGVPRRLLAGREAQLATLLEHGLVAWHGDRLVLTRQGKGLADPIAAELL